MIKHCEFCGLSNPIVEEGGTGCCGESVCQGDTSYRIKIGRWQGGQAIVLGEIRSCCLGQAETQAKEDHGMSAIDYAG